MRLKKPFAIISAMAFFVSTVVTGCGSSNDVAMVSTENYVFPFELGFDIDEAGVESFGDIFNIYLDSDMTCGAGANCSYDEDTNTVTVEPPTNDNMSISGSTMASDEEKQIIEQYVKSDDDFYLFETDENDRWGNANKYYMVLYRDLETGEVLDKPLVTVFSVKGELDAPTNFRYSQTDYGEAKFTWDEVYGADYYLVVRCDMRWDDEYEMSFDTLSVEGVVDPKYYDSFTPYGVLIDKVGVCASYAGAFKLLCDEAGVECIVVTGYLDGSVAHAWNKVYINDRWQIVDVTNNDTDGLYNALLNIPDYASEGVLVEDELFAMDDSVDNYTSTDTDNEYYRISDKYYDVSSIDNQLAAGLSKGDSVVLRTDYSLSDTQFYDIANSVMDITGDDDLYGYYWMGVIYLRRNK